VDTDGLISIGKIVGIHGIKGALKVYPYTETPEALFRTGRRLIVKQQQGPAKTVLLKWAKPHKRVFLVALDGVTDCDAARAWVGSQFFVEKKTLPELDPDTYYWSDIIGLTVVTTDGTAIGRVEAIMPTGSNDVYVVKDKEKETLIPALASVVLEIDLAEKIMRVNLPEGL
jgi:16S rRNA processing protein RimM